MARSEENMTQSAQGSRRQVLSEVTWESVNDPGAYVERGSGDLFRFPKESLIPGASPSIVKESRGASVLLKLSDDLHHHVQGKTPLRTEQRRGELLIDLR